MRKIKKNKRNTNSKHTSGKELTSNSINSIKQHVNKHENTSKKEKVSGKLRSINKPKVPTYSSPIPGPLNINLINSYDTNDTESINGNGN